MTWRNVDKSRPDSAHYSCLALERNYTGMEALRGMFPEAQANEMNLVLFSTSGVHGTYNTIEDAEKALNGDGEQFNEVTFLIVHPRLASVRYGNCAPISADDIDFLKRLRESSHAAALMIGMPE